MWVNFLDLYWCTDVIQIRLLDRSPDHRSESISKMAVSDSPVTSVTILYGSETGNAQDYAHYLARKLRYNSLKPTVASLDSYPLKKLITDTKYLIVICSTTGQGELPRNLKGFMKFLLKKKLPGDLLNHIHMTSFGLGDSSYPKFNYAIKKIHTRLLQLGCTELSPRCESDEMAAEGIDGYYAEWEATLIDALKKKFTNIFSIDENVLLPPEYTVEVDKGAADIVAPQNLHLTRQSPALLAGTVTSNARVTAPDHFQDIRLLTIETDTEVLDYAPGDTLALYPCNDERSVQLLLELQPHLLEIADKPLTVPGKIDVDGGFVELRLLTLRTLIANHLDIMSIPRRSFFSLLFHFVDDSTEDGSREKEKLKEFGNLEDSEELYNYANRPRRLILETIMEFEKNLHIPIEYVLDLFPLIKVRLFLIASKPSPTSVLLLVGIVEYKTMLRRIRRGLCTKWIKQLAEGDKLLFSVHKSNIKFLLPQVPAPPILMIAPGTGLAPMKSLIESSAGTQDLYLFYGCRYREKDYLFADLWTQYEQKGQLKIFPAISRDAGSKYKYVQDKLHAEKELVADLLVNQNAIVFVCGSSGKMPREVRITLVEAIKELVPDADKFLLNMENQGKYIQETW